MPRLIRTTRSLAVLVAVSCLGACAATNEPGTVAPAAGTGGTGVGAGTGGRADGGGGVGAATGGQTTGGSAGSLATGGTAGTAIGGGAGGGAGMGLGGSSLGGSSMSGDGGLGGVGGAGSGGNGGVGGVAAGAGGTAGGGTAGTAGGAGTATGGSAGSAGMNGDPCSAVRVGAGDMHTCALTGDGSVYCWGSNAEAAVGNGAMSRQLTPYLVTGAGKDNVDLLVGHHVSCVKKVSGAFSCWGTFDDGPGFANVRDPRVFDVFGNDVRDLVVDTSACVIRTNGSVACWGYENAAATTFTGFGTDATQIALEFNTVCVVKTGGSVMCRTDTAAPRTVSGVSDAVAVGLRRDHNGLGEPEDVMAAGADGRAYYAHNGASFQAMNLAGQKAVLWNAQHHLIGAISDTGGVMLWHSAICGGFGDNNPPEDNGSTAGDRRNYTQNAPAVPTGFSSGATRELALGHEHACVIRASDASVYCWGRNVEGQIGNGMRATECEVGAGSHNPGPDGNQMTPYKVTLCQ